MKRGKKNGEGNFFFAHTSDSAGQDILLKKKQEEKKGVWGVGGGGRLAL